MSSGGERALARARANGGASLFARATAWASIATLALAACAGGRDAVPETHDVSGNGTATADGVTAEGGYDYVARRPRAVVALAEGRGLDRAVSVAATDKVADQMEACTEDLAKRGQLVRGAARVAARIGPGGNISGIAVKVAPGAAVAANAILCFIAPVKSLVFPALGAEGADAGGGPSVGGPGTGVTGAGDRGIALEATWEP